MSSSDDLYDEILAHGPSSETLFIVLSKLREAGHHKRVIQECIKAIEAHPNDMPLRQLLSETYFEMGLFAHAEAQVEKLVSHMDELASLYKLQAMIYHKGKRFQETISSLKLYLAHRPDDQDASHLLESLCPTEKPAEISGAAETPSQPVEFLVKMEPEVAQETEEETAVIEKEDFLDIATPTLAEVYLNQGQIAEALDIYERIIADNPEDHASRQRVVELKAMLAPPTLPEPSEGDDAREKKEKMIATLTTWLEELRKTSH
jgi:tetratricopeptide (TPR) repeat protein